MADGQPITTSETSVANGNSLTINGSESTTGAIDITELGGTGSANIYREVDTANDDSWATSVLIEQTTGNWHSQKNLGIVSQNQNIRLRVKNTSGSTADYFAAGYEVEDHD